MRNRIFAALRPALLVCSVPALIVACSSPATKPAPTPQRDPVAKAPADRTAPIGKRGGGFYLDDGPGDNPPPNMEAIPDAQPRAEPLHRYANNPYAVLGRNYVPYKTLTTYKKQGMGSWYGRKFHGQNTSSGEVYDMYGMTAAHPTLPIPSYVRVTNVASGKSVVVRVNDRGPFLSDRVIDLSYTAAYKLGYANRGSALVEVESITPGATLLAQASPDQPRRVIPASAAAAAKTAGNGLGDRPTPVLVASAAPGAAAFPQADQSDPIAEIIAAAGEGPPPATVTETGGRFLQLAAFSSRQSAESFRDHLSRQIDWLAERMVIRPKGNVFRLHAGPYASAAEAARAADRVRQALDLKPFVVNQ
ncbi:MAG: septal ring lytic transglycosylase RlpA family protein [Rhodocyclaceae bacterium]